MHCIEMQSGARRKKEGILYALCMLIRQLAHARFHHPDQHIALDIFDRHFESSLYQGASASLSAARTALEQCHLRGFVTVY